MTTKREVTNAIDQLAYWRAVVQGLPANLVSHGERSCVILEANRDSLVKVMSCVGGVLKNIVGDSEVSLAGGE